MLLEILSGNTDPTRLNVKPGEPAPSLCGTVPDILGGWMSMTLISTLFEALYGIHKCTSVEVATFSREGEPSVPSSRAPNTDSLEGRWLDCAPE